MDIHTTSIHNGDYKDMQCGRKVFDYVYIPRSLKTELNHAVFNHHGLPPSNWITPNHAQSRLNMRYISHRIMYIWVLTGTIKRLNMRRLDKIACSRPTNICLYSFVYSLSYTYWRMHDIFNIIVKMVMFFSFLRFSTISSSLFWGKGRVLCFDGSFEGTPWNSTIAHELTVCFSGSFKSPYHLRKNARQTCIP